MNIIAGINPKSLQVVFLHFNILKRRPAPDFEIFDDTETDVIIMSGIAGSGNDFAIPLAAIEKMIDKMEVTKLWEAMEVACVMH